MQQTKKRVKLYKRKWLNPKDSSDSGMVSYKVHHDEGSSWISAELGLWDCNRKITLDFDCGNYEQAKNRAIKLDILIESLQEMKVQLGKCLSYDDVFEDCDYDED